jgi:hypothetical protein
LDSDFVAECQNLFEEADEYFNAHQKEIQERRIKISYERIGSRINTNLKGLKHSKLIQIR